MKGWFTFDALIASIPGTFAPVIAMLKTTTDWNWQNVTLLFLLPFVGFAGSIAAYRSTKFAQANFTLTEKPVAMPEKSPPAIID